METLEFMSKWQRKGDGSGLMKIDANLIALRPATVDDDAFLFELYLSTRSDELAAVGWNDQQREAFLRMQFEMQRRGLPEGDNHIVLLEERRIGRFMLRRTEEAIFLVDITIVPEFRNLGFGAKLINDLIEDSTLTGKPIHLHVLASNFAKRLYDRLGFVVVDDNFAIGSDKAYLHMIWAPRATS